MAKYDVIRKFYKSDKWKIARAIKIASANGICQDCNKNPGTEVHHIIHNHRFVKEGNYMKQFCD